MALALVAAGLLVAFTLTGYADHEVGSASTQPKDRAVGLGVSGPIVDLSGPEPAAQAAAPDEIALTFDDGPDPKWTPQVLAVLAKYRVPATFFVVGTQALSHPELVREEVRAGHDVGSHTFTHADIGDVPEWRARLELSLTQSAIADATGRTTSLLRLPYSSGSDSLTAGQINAAKAAAHEGYLIVNADLDPDDWRRPGIDAIVQRSTPEAGRGGIVLLHDAGGDRSETVAALDRLIPDLLARGYRFTTVSQMAHLSSGIAARPGSALDDVQGRAVAAGFGLSRRIVGLLMFLLVPIGVLAVGRNLALVFYARRHRRRSSRVADFDLRDLPSVSVVIPAYNEAVGIAATVRSVVASRRAPLEVIVVDDGSTDATADIVEALDLPGVVLVRQRNTGKPGALEAGVALARGEVVVTIDGDTIVDPDLVGRLASRFTDPAVGAASGNAKVGNRRGFLGRFQHLEYVLGFSLERRMYDVLGCMPTVPGAAGAFRRRAIIDAGGFTDETLAEDTDVTMGIVRAGWRVVYEPTAVAWTEAPTTLRALWRQRYRWSYGTMQSMWKHRAAVRERDGLGTVGLPYMFTFQVVLPLFAPVIDLMAVYGLVFLDPGPVIAYWAGYALLQAAVGAYALRMDGERLRVLWIVPFQQIVLRQLMYLVAIQSVLSALDGARLSWQPQRRSGLERPDLSRSSAP